VTPEERRAKRPIGRDVATYQSTIQELEWLATVADDRGIDNFGVTEHHFHTEGNESIPNSLIFFAKLAAKTQRITFMPLSIVLPAHDPLRAAEDIALFDNMFPGRVAVSFARGYVTRWMQTLTQKERIGASPIDHEANERNREIFNEYLDVVIKAWTQETFNHNGKHYQAPYPATGIHHWPPTKWTREYGADGEVDDEGTIHKIGVIPKPVTQPYPQIWTPIPMSHQSLIEAARRRFIAVVYEARPEVFRKWCEDYRDAATQAGHSVRLGQGIGAMRKMFLANSFEEAFESAVKTAGYWFNNYFSQWGVNETLRLPTDDPNKWVSFSSDRECAQRMIEAGQFFCGTPDDVSRQLESLHRCHGDGELEWLVWEWWVAPDDTRDDQLRRLDMFVNKIWPRFK
jgi:alkanesulfonate monooxygenase SsuD/methylene tetrahydromethanopterin reductase-like flavin-dependent oxidoreductase (luciferase family)